MCACVNTTVVVVVIIIVCFNFFSKSDRILLCLQKSSTTTAATYFLGTSIDFAMKLILGFSGRVMYWCYVMITTVKPEL